MNKKSKLRISQSLAYLLAGVMSVTAFSNAHAADKYLDGLKKHQPELAQLVESDNLRVTVFDPVTGQATINPTQTPSSMLDTNHQPTLEVPPDFWEGRSAEFMDDRVMSLLVGIDKDYSASTFSDALPEYWDSFQLAPGADPKSLIDAVNQASDRWYVSTIESEIKDGADPDYLASLRADHKRIQEANSKLVNELGEQRLQYVSFTDEGLIYNALLVNRDSGASLRNERVDFEDSSIHGAFTNVTSVSEETLDFLTNPSLAEDTFVTNLERVAYFDPEATPQTVANKFLDEMEDSFDYAGVPPEFQNLTQSDLRDDFASHIAAYMSHFGVDATKEIGPEFIEDTVKIALDTSTTKFELRRKGLDLNPNSEIVGLLDRYETNIGHKTMVSALDQSCEPQSIDTRSFDFMRFNKDCGLKIGATKTADNHSDFSKNMALVGHSKGVPVYLASIGSARSPAFIAEGSAKLLGYKDPSALKSDLTKQRENMVVVLNVDALDLNQFGDQADDQAKADLIRFIVEHEIAHLDVSLENIKRNPNGTVQRFMIDEGRCDVIALEKMAEAGYSLDRIQKVSDLMHAYESDYKGHTHHEGLLGGWLTQNKLNSLTESGDRGQVISESSAKMETFLRKAMREQAIERIAEQQSTVAMDQ
jgi:hypothetical protein